MIAEVNFRFTVVRACPGAGKSRDACLDPGAWAARGTVSPDTAHARYYYKARTYSATLGRYAGLMRSRACQVAGVIGDGLAIAGLLTGNPVLAGVGLGISVGSTVLSGALNVSQRDYVGLTGDIFGAGAGMLPGGKLVRRIGGASIDPGRNAAGRFVANWRGKQAAQDVATQGLQERVTGTVVGAVGCPGL